MTNEDLAEAHGEFLLKAKEARHAGEIDLAQKYLRFIRPMNEEMSRRMRDM